MLSLCVPACVVPAYVVPDLFLRGAWHLVFVHETGGIMKSLLSAVLHKCMWYNELAAVAIIVRG